MSRVRAAYQVLDDDYSNICSRRYKNKKPKAYSLTMNWYAAHTLRCENYG